MVARYVLFLCILFFTCWSNAGLLGRCLHCPLNPEWWGVNEFGEGRALSFQMETLGRTGEPQVATRCVDLRRILSPQTRVWFPLDWTLFKNIIFVLSLWGLYTMRIAISFWMPQDNMTRISFWKLAFVLLLAESVPEKVLSSDDWVLCAQSWGSWNYVLKSLKATWLQKQILHNVILI